MIRFNPKTNNRNIWDRGYFVDCTSEENSKYGYRMFDSGYIVAIQNNVLFDVQIYAYTTCTIHNRVTIGNHYMFMIREIPRFKRFPKIHEWYNNTIPALRNGRIPDYVLGFHLRSNWKTI